MRELQDALAQARDFAADLDRGIEAERRRLARELHDQFGQIATAIRMTVLGLRKTHPSAGPAIDEVVQLVDEAIGMSRRVSHALRPPLLDDLGLAAAIEHFTAGIERQSGLKVQCDVCDDTTLTPAQANQLFRILQEAVTHVLRHARATELRIEGVADEGVYGLHISDNGVGPDAVVRPETSGVRNMRARAQMIGAVLQFGPGPAHGTRVSVAVPLPPQE